MNQPTSTHSARPSSTRCFTRAAIAALLLAHAPAAFAQDGATTAPAAEKPAAPAVNLPSAAEILAKSLEATGGKETWSKITSMESKGSMEIPAANIKGPMHTLMAAPNKTIMRMELAGFGSLTTAFDGTVGWSSDPTGGARILEGEERDLIAREAEILKNPDPMARWDSVKTIGEGEFGGFDCWKLEATRGDTKSILWFEKSTGLARGSESTVATQMGDIPVKSVLQTYTEYKGDFGAVKLATRTEASQMGQKMVATIDTVTFNAVAADAFALPKEVQELLKPEPTEDEELGEEMDGEAPAAAPAEKPATPAAPATPKKEG
jgi:hypothetical protein